ncbi:23S rRNA (cytidine2498-2'-O)-methyltransferase [Limimonas halophila]|uniref:23S rRNA (Cytidine2498-2'-O)-methyltransferase n=1 Tax=Limimonas halophila TaxID=1082479 RepID=A0A1G7M6F3_9PROT|nr:SAM-dependent methyltransferase [Limimonas halophila]SDF57274.1 23S rRNA (cytidine2498-2'-O)-methyltransferase [Limimonas halophila]
MSDLRAFVAPAGFEPVLHTELTRAGVPVRATHGRLIVTDATGYRAAWAQDTWHDPRELPAPSIKKAAANLRALQRSWWLLPTELHRRAHLIAEHLPHVSAKPLTFGDAPPTAPLGGWTLLAPDRMLAAPTTGSPFPNGEPRFVEDRDGPPNRAYLKLWEAFTVLGTQPALIVGAQPAPGETCLDLGAAPGGWTWVLAKLGARVTAVDKAPLADTVAAMPGVAARRDSAFGLRPQHVGHVDWLFSDIACEPAKLLELVHRWLDAGRVRNFVCTLKFQGETDFDAQAAFAAIPGSRLMHLHHNKHELTWVNLEADRLAATG